MAAMYLGQTITGAALLPPLRWVNGSEPGIGADHSKQIDKATMLGGSVRYHFAEHHPRRWSFSWDMLTSAELSPLETLNGVLDGLWFQNNWEDATWREVVITSFKPTPVVVLGETACRYRLEMELEEQEG